MKFRTILSIVTLILLAIVVIFGWPEIVRAVGLLGRTNLLILALLIPVQLFSYYAVGGIIFSYLRAKGNLKDVSHWLITRWALELNFVNHILPSGGAAGFSYLGWLLKRHGVSVGRATFAQIIRFVLTFVSFVMLMIISVVYVAFDIGVNRIVLLVSGALVVAMVGGIFTIVYVIGNQTRLNKFASWLGNTVNRLVKFLTASRKSHVINVAVIQNFFIELHTDYHQLRKEKRILVKPFIWAIVANIADVALLYIAFWSLGVAVHPAMLLVAFGVASIAGSISITPGGTGVYEAIMIAFLASAGVPADLAIAGTLLARVTLLLGTIVFGYIFYQLTLLRYGKVPVTS